MLSVLRPPPPTQLLEELRESEANDRCLQEYADLLLKRIKESEPDILDQFQ